MRSSHFALLGCMASLFACSKIDSPAALHKLVKEVPSVPVKTSPFVADTLLSFTRAELISIFGKENVVDHSLTFISEDQAMPSVLLFPSTDREVELILRDSTQESDVYAAIIRKNSIWSISNGLRPGMTLKEIEILNGTTFLFHGGGWAEGGMITNWNSGNVFHPHLKYCRLDRSFLMPYDVSKGDYHLHEFSSAAPDAQRGNPAVEEIMLADN